MARHLEWTAEAVEDLEGIANFIGRDSPLHAALTVSRIVERTEQALAFP